MPELDPTVVQWSRPAGERAGTPLLVLLHGVGSNERDLMGLAPGLASEWTLASLRAPLRVGPGFGWYPLSTPGSPDPVAVDAGLEAVLAWLDGVAGDHGRIGLLGFSQGASMALQALRTRPTGFAFAVGLSGFVVPGVTDGRDEALATVRPPVFLGHGDADPVIPPAATARTAEWAAAHTAVTERTYPGLPHAVSAEELADVRAFIDQH
jgi:phospholipase/carboxylesterase